jgi:hypothetical protein
MSITIDEIHQVTAIIGDVAVIATTIGAVASGVGSLLGSFGLLRAEAVADKVSAGSIAVGVDVKKFITSLGGLTGLFGKKKV